MIEKTAPVKLNALQSNVFGLLSGPLTMMVIRKNPNFCVLETGLSPIG